MERKSAFTVSTDTLDSPPSAQFSLEPFPCRAGESVRVHHDGLIVLRDIEIPSSLSFGPLRGSVEAIHRGDSFIDCEKAPSLEAGILDLAGNFSGFRSVVPSVGASEPEPILWPSTSQ